MHRRRVVLVSLATMAVLAAAACGGGGDGEPATETVSAAAWMGGLCTGLSTWQTELTENAPDLSS